MSDSPAHYLVIDFEATCCDRGSVPRHEMEIIEIGAVMVAADTLAPLAEFQRFIRPVRHRRLTAFCTQLTSITQADVDGAGDFKAVMAEFRDWLAPWPDLVFGSWGDYDERQLRQDCSYHRVGYPIRGPHLNLKRAFAEKQGLERGIGLGQAVRLAGLRFAGTHHRGIDDARNITRLLPYSLGRQALSKS
ncbi:exonuclease domain-containing protein [Chitinimonas lacunae]|uniref:Exonuclease domain-containing protein n=1 Tax=Chitinimonas lacunae TaxID=1963018 RepID=A0ABV8MN12_9NEIS